jgi:two-component system CheB/CheR fusion protein
LAPIRNSLFVLGHVEPASAQAQRARVVIERQVRHLTHLVDALLDVTRIVHGRIELSRRRVELGELLHAAVEDHRLSFEQSGIELEEQFGSGPFWVQGDPERLIQIASNLLDNALKFTPSGGRVEVRLGLDLDGEKVEIHVDDTGVGIAPEMRAQLFQPFSQAPQNIARTHGGLGLGLATVKGLMQLHGGDIHVASPGPGQGTQIVLRLPADDGPASSVLPLPERPARKRRVLVIEDNPDASETLKEALALNGHEVQLASDGRRALAIANSFLPDVVICDIGLPGMDGYAVARAFRAAERLRDVYLVALSGYARPADRRRAAEAGFNQHFAKPSSLTGLVRLVAEAPSGSNDSSAPHPPGRA